MTASHTLLRGAFCLTAAGILSRIAGFFYKIFLSRMIGAEQIGLYHLCIPLCSFCLAACTGGIQTAISRFTAEYTAKDDRRTAFHSFLCALGLSLLLSLSAAVLLYANAGALARIFLAEPRCARLLQIIACSLPFSALHTCACGYLIGQKKTGIPALSQILEQFFRISAVLLFCFFQRKQSGPISAAVMALGQLAGELASSLFCLLCLANAVPRRAHAAVQTAHPPVLLHRNPSSLRAFVLPGAVKKCVLCREIQKLLAVSVPLGLSRMLLGILQAIEAALLPQQLRLSGLDSSAALSLYGTLTGMALPLLFFPTAITSAFGTLLLPWISEARAKKQPRRIQDTARAAFLGSLLLGLFFFSLFFLYGRELGQLLFASEAAGDCICSLSLLCPLLYTHTTMVSVLHGIGKTGAVSAQNTAGFLLRLLFTLLLVPDRGIRGYFLGLLISYAFLLVFALFTLFRSRNLLFQPASLLIRPLLVCILSTAFTALLRIYVPYLQDITWSSVLTGSVLCLLSFASLSALFFGRHLF